VKISLPLWFPKSFALAEGAWAIIIRIGKVSVKHPSSAESNGLYTRLFLYLSGLEVFPVCFLSHSPLLLSFF
jgi:hypothetical protein